MIKIRRLYLVVGVCFFGISSSAVQKQIVYRKSETQKFSGLKLKGEFKKPDLSYIYQRKGIRSEQIVDIPEDFNREIREDGQRF
jgi:hypothetical protein